ncbi:hypothetical protein D3C80_1968070 [compost metagenome]
MAVRSKFSLVSPSAYSSYAPAVEGKRFKQATAAAIGASRHDERIHPSRLIVIPHTVFGCRRPPAQRLHVVVAARRKPKVSSFCEVLFGEKLEDGGFVVCTLRG